MPRQIVTTIITTPLGQLVAGATSRGICLLEFAIATRLQQQVKILEKYFGTTPIAGKSPFFGVLRQELKEYFSRKSQTFSLPLDICGTTFQQKVWTSLLAIPYGATTSYSEQALSLGTPKAVRAVAYANRNNKIAILIPCHRVIGKDGAMTGYGGEIWRKEYLISLEQTRNMEMPA